MIHIQKGTIVLKMPLEFPSQGGQLLLELPTLSMMTWLISSPSHWVFNSIIHLCQGFWFRVIKCIAWLEGGVRKLGHKLGACQWWPELPTMRRWRRQWCYQKYEGISEASHELGTCGDIGANRIWVLPYRGGWGNMPQLGISYTVIKSISYTCSQGFICYVRY